jgi:hypothetical protein
MINKKEFIVKNETAFRLKVSHWKCLTPPNLNALEFIQECINQKGEVDFTSSYQFFMTDNEIDNLINGLTAINGN